MDRVLLLLTVCFALTCPAIASEASARRVALVIGNNAYQHVTPLEKAANDARAVGQALEKVGFKTTVLLEASQRGMNSAINRFVEDLSGGGMGVLFFAGHGVQINNQNFLLPVDFESPRSEADVADQAVSLQVLQDKLAQAQAKFALLVIDACRDNPLPRKAGRSLGGLRGLAQASSAEGQMVVFSAGANQQALDKLDDRDRHPNGVFTREFLPWIDKPGVSIREAMLEVRSAVRQRARSVNHEQFPAVYDQAEGDFYFLPPSQPRRLTPSQAELLFWQSVQNSPLAEDFDDYLKLYPDGLYASLAKRKAQGLRMAAAKPAPEPPPRVDAPTPLDVPSAPPVAGQEAPSSSRPAPAMPIPAEPKAALAKPSGPAPLPATASPPSRPPAGAAPPTSQPAAATRAWDYEVVEQYGRNVVGRYRVEVAPDGQGGRVERISINNGAKVLTRPLGPSQGLEMQVFRLPNDTNYWITDFSPYLGVGEPLKPGQSWPVSLPMGDMSPCQGEARVKDVEDIRTPAGNFRGSRVRLECQFQKNPMRSDRSTLILDAWYVPELGRVARIDKRVPPASQDDLGEERESYQLKRVEPR